MLRLEATRPILAAAQMALRLLLLPAAVLNMIALAAATTGPLDPRDEMALGPARLNQHDHNNHARRAVHHHHHRKHLSRRRIKNEARREAPAYAARQVRDSREAHRRWFRRLEDDGEGELARRAAPSSVPVVCLGTVTAYQQCGGMGWSGDTCCIAGYTCVVSDAYCKLRKVRSLKADERKANLSLSGDRLAMQAGRDDDDHFGHHFDVFERIADSVRMHGGSGRVRPVWRSRIYWRHVLSVGLLLLVQQPVL